MGLAETFRAAAVSGRKAFGNAFLLCDYGVAPVRADYDAPTGKVLWHNPAPPTALVPIVFVDYDLAERQAGDIPATDLKAFVAALDIAGITPKVGDVLRQPAGEVYELRGVKTDPVSALYELQITPYEQVWPW